MEPPACTGYQNPFASLEGNAVCLTSGASPAEGKNSPYYRGRWTRYSPGWKKTSRRRVLISLSSLLGAESTMSMVWDLQEVGISTNTSSFSSAALVKQ